jgi:hypothetical protein
MIRTPVALAAAALLLGSYVAPASANIFHVDDDGLDPFECEAAPFHTIHDALAVANPRDEIRVCPGIYAEQVVPDHRMRLIGISFGSAQPVIRPTSLPVSRPSLLGQNPVTGAIIVDNEFVRLSNLEIDLSGVSQSTCLPFLTGVYLRGASGAVDLLKIENVRLTGAPACNSGVGLYIESGITGEILGVPQIVPSWVNATSGVRVPEGRTRRDSPRTEVNVRAAVPPVAADGRSAQYGYQLAMHEGKSARRCRDSRSLVGKAAGCSSSGQPGEHPQSDVSTPRKRIRRRPSPARERPGSSTCSATVWSSSKRQPTASGSRASIISGSSSRATETPCAAA